MAGYSGTPLLKKLGIKPGYSVLFVDAPDHFRDLLGDFPEGAHEVDLSHTEPIDFIHIFCRDETTLHNLMPMVKTRLAKHGSLWVSWIKKASKNHQWTITDMDVRNFGLHLGLVDVKVCAIDEDWSGLKFMYRKEDR
jgi:hypothetical protein